ncbi:GntR family transcriptional regulator [Rhodococcus sp. USK10]|nr:MULTISPECIES: GntR family transcriptional regulator [Rhodococcus]QYB07110.1 GntR family transcriptional regulator [Rhodococcus sp. USK10]
MLNETEIRTTPRVPKASDILANLLKTRILGEGLGPGDRLPSEAELIGEYQFSRGTVREALRMLEADGIVVVRRGPRGGIEVSSPDATQVTRSFALLFAFDGTPVSDIMDFRLVVEPGAAAMAAASATPEQKQQLLSAAEHPGTDAVPHSVDFHRALGLATNNRFMGTILTAVYEVLEWQTKTQKLSTKERWETDAAHRAIAESIEQDNAERAAHQMSVHLEEFKEVLRKQGRLTEAIIPKPTADTSPQGSAWY